MHIYEKEIVIPRSKTNGSPISFFERKIMDSLSEHEIPIRFVVTKTDAETYNCEVGLISGVQDFYRSDIPSIFEFIPRRFENTELFNAVLLVPTGIGAEIGGHAGDAAPVARLLASACDHLITHPNVVNASEINELPENGLYVEGSAITQLLMGTVGLQPVRSNRVLLVMDKHAESQITEMTINTVSAARAAMGLDCPAVVELDSTLSMSAEYSSSSRAIGRIEHLEKLCETLHKYRAVFDAVALSSKIRVPKELPLKYLQSKGEMVNPWGGVEAMLTHAITLIFGVPTAHAPMEDSMEMVDMHAGVVDPRISAEAGSACYLQCVFKGLHKSPRLISDASAMNHPGVLSVKDISCLIIPDGCLGLPTLAALEQDIPVIAVRENKNWMRNNLEELPFSPGKLFIVDNYLEAVGIMAAMKAGIAPETVRRPISYTNVIRESQLEETVAEYRDEKVDEGKDKKKPGLSVV